MTTDWGALLEDEQRREGAALRDDYEHLARQLARRGIDIAAVRAAAGVRGRHSLVGRRHRRHALRPLPGTGRAAQHLRQARRLRASSSS